MPAMRKALYLAHAAKGAAREILRATTADKQLIDRIAVYRASNVVSVSPGTRGHVLNGKSICAVSIPAQFTA